MTNFRSFFDDAVDLDGKTILVTGGTGSFGNAFADRVLAKYDIRKLIVFSRDEQKQFQMEHRLGGQYREKLRFFLGDVRDAERLELAMSGVDVVIHAAALKHVPLAEYNPFECIKTNVHGAENVSTAARRAGVSRVIALSTDKAANPINIYGASKLASDKIFIAANNLTGKSGTRYAVVRYGNVIGSRGSVIPFFKELVANGADHLPITDERMTRFAITLEQGVDFVLSSLKRMEGGEIFVPKIPSLKVTDLARTVAPDLPTKVVGVRPGEKLHELMITGDDARSTWDLGDRFVIMPTHPYWRGEGAAPAGKQVAEDFSYISNTNDEWVSDEEMRALVDEIE
jgi:UDP-N-acetylglucosamine 4,6-dehydratase